MATNQITGRQVTDATLARVDLNTTATGMVPINLRIINATTTNTNDSIKITSADGSALSSTNIGFMPTLDTSGNIQLFQVTSDVTILLTGAHWGHDTTGDLSGAILRVLAINDNGTLKWGVAYIGNRKTLLTTDTTATGTSVTTAEYILCTSAIGSANNTSFDAFWFRANFDDTGGASENLWIVQTSIGSLNYGSADGYWQPWNPVQVGGTSPAVNMARVSQVGLSMILNFDISITSNSTSWTVTTPTKSNAASTTTGICAVVTQNNSVFEAGGFISFNTNASTHNLYRSGTVTSTWTAALTKRMILGAGSYEIGPAASFV